MEAPPRQECVGQLPSLSKYVMVCLKLTHFSHTHRQPAKQHLGCNYRGNYCLTIRTHLKKEKLLYVINTSLRMQADYDPDQHESLFATHTDIAQILAAYLGTTVGSSSQTTQRGTSKVCGGVVLGDLRQAARGRAGVILRRAPVTALHDSALCWARDAGPQFRHTVANGAVEICGEEEPLEGDVGVSEGPAGSQAPVKKNICSVPPLAAAFVSGTCPGSGGRPLRARLGLGLMSRPRTARGAFLESGDSVLEVENTLRYKTTS